MVVELKLTDISPDPIVVTTRWCDVCGGKDIALFLTHDAQLVTCAYCNHQWRCKDLPYLVSDRTLPNFLRACGHLPKSWPTDPAIRARVMLLYEGG